MEKKKEQITDHEFCLRCGRKLKNPTAREKGYGAICEKKLRIITTQRLFGNVAQNRCENDDNLQSS